MDTANSTDLYQAVVISVFPAKTGFTYEFELICYGEDKGQVVTDIPKIFPTTDDAMVAALNEAYWDCAISQLYNTLYEWEDFGLITPEEFDAAETALHGGDRS